MAVSKGDSVLLDKLEVGAIVWLVEEEADHRGRVWVSRYDHKFGIGYRTGRRIHVDRVIVVSESETIYDWPHNKWDPDEAERRLVDRLTGFEIGS